ncbi:error-prone DNA polymerase [Jonesia quinghaiensis]|uniref:error-prone DNA polymerase n=1 Tax=Jonesia quinghaiensis TaxID=262806 RepID=UPI000418EC67|nr:error-prone DNA polymerase [Jonesia quinghaiensis]
MTKRPAAQGRYAELHAHSTYSFLDGAATPADLVAQAHNLGLEALALTDHNGLYGAVQLANAARDIGMPTIFGAEVTVSTQQRPGESATQHRDPNGEHLVLLARGPAGYQNLSHALALGHLAGGHKGTPHYTYDGLSEQANNQWMVLAGCRKSPIVRAASQGDRQGAIRAAHELRDRFGASNVALDLIWRGIPGEDALHDALADIATTAGLPLIASTSAHYATADQHRRAEALAAIRAGVPLADLDPWRAAFPSAHLRSARDMAHLHRTRPHIVSAAAELAADLTFNLNLVAPNLPPYPVPEGHSEATWLRHLTMQGASRVYGSAHDNPTAWRQIHHELDIIVSLGFPGYFLIVDDIMRFCTDNRILAQGRGSAANSAVCYALGITAVDAVRHQLLFERFLAPERDGPPDIDIDIESGRREEVIQYVYSRYGRHHAAQVANVITYRSRSAVRDAARILGYDIGRINAWSKGIDRYPRPTPPPDTLQPTPPAPQDSRTDIPTDVSQIANTLHNLPRHLGIHSGGMVLCDRPVTHVCPVEWGRMPGRTVVQWDKEDCADAGLVKFDLLGLGMLTALRIAFDHVHDLEGINLTLHTLPIEDPGVYQILQAADTVGVFQVESRAQIGTLPRLRPECFYDIVIEVALIRPGPIQGGSVHPYIRRRRGREAVTYPHPLLEKALKKTLGVPLFQEQLMHIAIDAAGFTPAESDQLRRAMGSKRSTERMEALRTRLLDGMAQRGIPPHVSDQIYKKLKAFADFGFPESHAFSFAHLVYASAYLKRHHPAAFYSALLAAQPMGFYSPQSLMNDARRHGLTIHRPCIATSHLTATPVPTHPPQQNPHKTPTPIETAAVPVPTHYDIHLGLTDITALTTHDATTIITERTKAPFTDLADLARRTKLTTPTLEALAAAGALHTLGITPRQGIWSAGIVTHETPDTLPGLTPHHAPDLPNMTDLEQAQADQRTTRITPHTYPTQLIRPHLTANNILTAHQVNTHEPERRITAAGIITHRQRPPTAAGITFLSLEDETGIINVICPVPIWNRHRRTLRTAQAIIVRGRVEHADGATNLVAEHVTPLTLGVASHSRDFR